MYFKMNKEIKLMFSLLACMSAESTLAASQHSESNLKQTLPRLSSYVVTLSAGPALSNNGHTQTISLQPDLEQTFAALNTSQLLASGEIFIGVQKELNYRHAAQFGLALAASSNANLNGDIWQDADPDFNNFSYKYQISHAHVAVKGKFLADFDTIVKPYMSVSLGIGFNRAHDFSVTSKLFQQIVPPAFQSNTTNSLTYTVGAGIQKDLNEHWQAGLGYEFADWGSSQLARASGQTINSGLSLSNLYTNSLQFYASYIG
jgi:opacity protein-like surface antigen